MALALLSLCACHMVTEGTGDGGGSSSESSSGEDDDADDESITTSDTADSDPGSSSGGGSSDGTTESSGGEEESSTGAPVEPITPFALHFDGSSYARKSALDGAYGWTEAEWTVEAWIEILDETATGVIFDAQNGGATGWALYIQPDWTSLVFSFYDSGNVNQVVEGPEVDDIGIGWHHVAATKMGDTVYLHVDGVAVKAQEVSAEPAYGPVTLSVGTVSTNESFWDLQGVNIDEIRITDTALYDANFDPPIAMDADSVGALFLLKLDEGAGVVAEESVNDPGLNFTIFNPSWVEGRFEDDV